MTPVLRHTRAFFCSAALLCVLVFALLYSPTLKPKAPLTIREVAVGMPPPPPPPPPSQRLEQQSSVPLKVSVSQRGTVPRLQGETLVLNVALPAVDAPAVETDDLLPEFQLDVAWDGFSLNELDQVPRLLSKPNLKFPRSLTRRGVRRVEVELLVTIDESGRVFLREIRRSTESEIDGLLPDVVGAARFTAPKKDGQPVRARFLWPLVFRADS
ncbi:MAG: hypothetical protein AAF648_06745 [Pseudomonadota bacterium]